MKETGTIQSIGLLFIRSLIGLLFLNAGVFSSHLQTFYFPYVTGVGLSTPEITQPVPYLLEIIAALLLALGLGARWAVTVLLFYSVLVPLIGSVLFAGWLPQFTGDLYLAHLGVIVGLFYVGIYGPGSYSVDRILKYARRE